MFNPGYKLQQIDGQKEKFVRLEDLDSRLSFKSDTTQMKGCGFNLNGLATAGRSKAAAPGTKGFHTLGKSFKFGVNKAVLQEDLKGVSTQKKILDPQDKIVLFWNKLLVISCILAVYIDPLFLFLPVFKDNEYEYCLHMDQSLAYITTILRTLIDAFYLVRIALEFRTAYIAPSSRVFGRGELVIDPEQISQRYLHGYFIIDLLSVLPMPQIVVWKFLLLRNNVDVRTAKRWLLFIVIIQYIPRFCRFVPLYSELKKSTGVFAETAWAGAAYYLLWFMLASHMFGSFWYLLSVELKETCWKKKCGISKHETQVMCSTNFLYCGQKETPQLNAWKNISQSYLYGVCNADGDDPPYNYGIFAQCISSGVLESETFADKYLYCLWWGLMNLSTLGQGLLTSINPVEVVFSITVAIAGLLLFALLIGNMQTYLQSITVRLEEMRVKRRDSEQWMHHRLLPEDLRERVRRYDQYKWLETRGVDEESLVKGLPKDLRRDIKRHLCLNLVRRVPLFENMDERLLDAICERLKPALYTENTFVLQEGDLVDEMLFIIRGRLESVTTDGGRTGFFNRGYLKENDFCGDELLTWALDPKAGSNLPPSTRMVKALTEVEAFALPAEELKYITSQFRRLHSRQIQHTFRFYSQQWRTWAASFIQAAWRRHCRRKYAELYASSEEEDEEYDDADEFPVEIETSPLIPEDGLPGMRATMLASRFAANAMRGVHHRRGSSAGGSGSLPILPKPPEPDFDADA